MFQVLSRRVLLSNSSAVSALQFSRLNSTLQNRTRAKEIRDVKLIGTINQEPLTLKDGTKILTIKTVQPDSHYKVHRAIVRSSKILGIFGDSLLAGQRVFVAGDLQAQSFVNNENRHRQSFQVKVNELYVSKAEADPKSVDFNNVCILSHIASDINHFDNHSVFSLSGHFIAKNITEGESEKVQFYRVYVHDPNLIEMLRNLQKKDRVLVNGFLASKPETDQNGQKKYSGHIEATQILKVDRFSEAVNERAAEEIAANE